MSKICNTQQCFFHELMKWHLDSIDSGDTFYLEIATKMDSEQIAFDTKLVNDGQRRKTWCRYDLNHLDLNHIYTFEEFEYINDQLKCHTLEINGEPVNLFELDKNGNLRPMPQKLAGNSVTGSGTSSQGGFNFHVRGKRTIRAPDVSFTSKNVYRHLTQQQLWTFQGESFTPTFVVGVGDTASISKFEELDDKFKSEYFAMGTSVQLDGDNILSGFTLNVEMIEDAISQTPSESEGELEINCPKCNESFTVNYLFMKHYEERHACKPVETVDRVMPT
ncbi:5578_t:CDS:2 [Ambispora gerdemannii]|uniref:5578_t:CDS:1 n=1 Tax=Ambispora gerdemannii TaxID=144530 RepID=A0A9N8VBV3_9GLOM|nr:5578_t:CDS:2 [Ambispora gerdemannii]